MIRIALVVGLLGALLGACSHHATEVIPHATSAIHLDGELGEPDWSSTALRHIFVDDRGAHAKPYSEISLLRDDQTLYLGLYAADEDIRSDEFFSVKIGSVEFHALADGSVTPALPGLKSAIDRDGTLDDPSNDDEEWVIEIAMPFVNGDVVAKRCDTPKDHVERCASASFSAR